MSNDKFHTSAETQGRWSTMALIKMRNRVEMGWIAAAHKTQEASKCERYAVTNITWIYTTSHSHNIIFALSYQLRLLRACCRRDQTVFLNLDFIQKSPSFAFTCGSTPDKSSCCGDYLSSLLRLVTFPRYLIQVRANFIIPTYTTLRCTILEDAPLQASPS